MELFPWFSSSEVKWSPRHTSMTYILLRLSNVRRLAARVSHGVPDRRPDRAHTSSPLRHETSLSIRSISHTRLHEQQHAYMSAGGRGRRSRPITRSCATSRACPASAVAAVAEACALSGRARGRHASERHALCTTKPRSGARACPPQPPGSSCPPGRSGCTGDGGVACASCAVTERPSGHQRRGPAGVWPRHDNSKRDAWGITVAPSSSARYAPLPPGSARAHNPNPGGTTTAVAGRRDQGDRYRWGASSVPQRSRPARRPTPARAT